MYGIHNDFLTGTNGNEKVGKDVSMPIAAIPGHRKAIRFYIYSILKIRLKSYFQEFI